MSWGNDDMMDVLTSIDELLGNIVNYFDEVALSLEMIANALQDIKDQKGGEA